MAVVPQKLPHYFSNADCVPLAAAGLPLVGELVRESGRHASVCTAGVCVCVCASVQKCDVVTILELSSVPIRFCRVKSKPFGELQWLKYCNWMMEYQTKLNDLNLTFLLSILSTLLLFYV